MLADCKKEPFGRQLCLKCLRPVSSCFCSRLSPVPTQSKIILLMHPKEAKRSHLGTGRLAKSILPNAEIIVGENFDSNEKVQNILNSSDFFPMLLYPGERSINLSKDQLIIPEERIPVIFVLDGTWPCAKSMMRDSHSLHSIMRISFDSSVESKFIIRQQPERYCLSTIESIYHLLCGLEIQGVEQLGQSKEELNKALQLLVDYQLECARDPSRNHYRAGTSYKPPEQRRRSKKWSQRQVCFLDKNYK